MLFSEIYSSYFHTVAAILTEASRGTLTDSKLNQLVRHKAFAESILTIPSALKEKWPLLEPELTTPLHNEPSLPLTTLELRWLKTLLQDPRIALFCPDTDGLEDVEPLFDLRDIVRFDQYLDGDPYEDEAYITVFRQLLTAAKEHRNIRIRYQGHTGIDHNAVCVPYRFEYSQKDDKFRILTVGRRNHGIVNIARIQSCELLERVQVSTFHEPKRRLDFLTFLLKDERNAMERVLLHFSHFQKETIKLGEGEYQVTLQYDRNDETELLIRVLSFGPMIKVIAPKYFQELIKERLKKQMGCGLQ